MSAFWFIVNVLLAAGLFWEGLIVVYMLRKLQISKYCTLQILMILIIVGLSAAA